MQERVYEACDRLNIAIVMHFDSWINRDKPGLTGFERMLKTYRNVKFIGHSPHFWREISGDVDSAVGYPNGRVAPGGRVEALFREYRNLYADLSAGSGYGAITRDPEFGLSFLKRWKHRLLFATDYLRVGAGNANCRLYQERAAFKRRVRTNHTDQCRKGIPALSGHCGSEKSCPCMRGSRP